MSAETPQMSRATRDVLMRVRKMIPPMLEKFHKGEIDYPIKHQTSSLTTGRTNG